MDASLAQLLADPVSLAPSLTSNGLAAKPAVPAFSPLIAACGIPLLGFVAAGLTKALTRAEPSLGTYDDWSLGPDLVLGSFMSAAIFVPSAANDPYQLNRLTLFMIGAFVVMLALILLHRFPSNGPVAILKFTVGNFMGLVLVAILTAMKGFQP
jgi:hypothetical protein